MSSDFAGARWWRFDFHTHTPASEDYGKGASQRALRERNPREWLLDFMRAEIDCLAVTDHNMGVWIDSLKQAYTELEQISPEWFRPLHLFPGVEISVHGGIHVLAIFGPEKCTSDVDSLLGAVGIRGAAKGSLAACTEQSPVEVAGRIRDAGGIAIPAHVDRENGLFTRLSGATLDQVLGCEHILAMEVCDSGFAKPGTRAAKQLAWSEVLGSDCHHPAGNDGQRYPGSHFTWVKMGRPSIEGLRLALLDGAPLSILRSDRAGGNPNEHARLAIESIEIHEAQYGGRGSRPLRVPFSPWMSALVGGRGTGKSTVLEMLRLGLRREQELPDELRGEFEKFARVPASRADRGALTNSTRLALILRKDGGRFRVHWRSDCSGPGIEEEDERGEWMRSPGEIPSRFPVRIFSQKQVFALAGDPGALLRLIDDAPAVDRSAWSAQHKELEARFLSLRSQVRELGARLADRARNEGDLADVRRQLAVFEEGGHREILVTYQRLGRQRHVLDDCADELQGAVERLRSISTDLEPADVRPEDFDAGQPAEAEALGLLREAADEQRSVAARVAALADELARYRERWGERIGRSAWGEREQEVDGTYSALVERLRQEGIEDPAAYGSLVQRRHALESRVAELNTLGRRMQELEDQAETVLSEIEKVRLYLTARRIAFLDRVLEGNEFVRITVIPFGPDAAAAESEFRKRLAREDGRLSDDILSADGANGILAELYRNLPSGRDERRSEIQRRIRDLKRRVAAIVKGSAVPGLTKWFRNHVRELRPELLDHLELWWPEDGLRVEYRRAGNERFLPIEQGSPGQKSAAILAFLLSHGEEPIVLDQPEDDLDNHLIYDLIVRQIRENKRRRQVIVATHNPNIVVNGDAELVVSMDHQRGQCIVRERDTGCLQERGVRDEVCRVMEGGRQAFAARYRRLLEEVDRG
jgi:hypothetical protein